ncbi:MAG: hypothetical protein OXU45_04480 [Candidatus Melainabacteria bacterium]|nr:hypothetical protein [Candidatus Melainabacteria bacterium]
MSTLAINPDQLGVRQQAAAFCNRASQLGKHAGSKVQRKLKRSLIHGRRLGRDLATVTRAKLKPDSVDSDLLRYSQRRLKSCKQDATKLGTKAAIKYGLSCLPGIDSIGNYVTEKLDDFFDGQRDCLLNIDHNPE